MDKVYSASADSTGTAVATVDNIPTGVNWIVWQTSVESSPFRSGANATMRRNGRYVTSTIQGGGSSAQGPPALLLTPNDTVTMTWKGLTAGDQGLMTLFVEEVSPGSHGSAFGLV